MQQYQNVEKVFKFANYFIGSPTLKEYETKKEISFSGPGNLWKIYESEKKGKKFALFLVDKKLIDGFCKGWQKKEQERLIELLKKEAEKLVKFRHPCFLEVAEPLEEDRLHLTFVTEALNFSLVDLLQKEMGKRRKNDMPFNSQQDEFVLDELEIQKGLQQIANALIFCHQNAGLVHAHLTPSAIFINVRGDWKLGGMTWSLPAVDSSLPSQSAQGNLANFSASDELYRHNIFLKPNIDYLAPECVFDRLIGIKSDIFSFACLIYDIFSQSPSTLLNCNGSIDTYKRTIERLDYHPLEIIPVELIDMVRKMLNRDYQSRPIAAEFLKCKYFDNILISTLLFLENIYDKTPDNKIQFYKGLTSILVQFPRRVLISKILPGLLEGLKDGNAATSILPNIFIISEKLTAVEMEEKLWPYFKNYLTSKDQVEGVIMVLDKMSLFLPKLSKNSIQKDMIPVLLLLLDSSNNYILQKTLKTINELLNLFDFTTVKTKLFPKISALYHSSSNISVRIHVLTCLQKSLENLDQFTLTDKVLPLLKENRPKNSLIHLACFKVYEDLAMKYLPKEVNASEILPELWKMITEPSFTLQQFESAMATIKNISKKIEDDQRRFLEQLKSTGKNEVSPNSDTSYSNQTDHQKSFENLVRGSESKGIYNNPPIVSRTYKDSKQAVPSANMKEIQAMTLKSLDLSNSTDKSKPNSSFGAPLAPNKFVSNYDMPSLKPSQSNSSINEFDPFYKGN